MSTRLPVSIVPAQAIAEHRQRTLGSDARIQLSETAGGTIPWIEKRFVTLLQSFGVVILKSIMGHINLAPNLESFRITLTDQFQRYRRNRTHICKNVFAGCSITARCRG